MLSKIIINEAAQRGLTDYQIHFEPNRNVVIKTALLNMHHEPYTIFIMSNLAGYMYDNQAPILLTDMGWTLMAFSHLNAHQRHLASLASNHQVFLDSNQNLQIKCEHNIASIAQSLHSMLKTMLIVDRTAANLQDNS